jgi:FkbM family methyltransferase
VLDVGANRGQFGAMLRRSGYAGRIISFEPVPEAFDELSAKILSDEGWEARRLALGNRAGLLPLNITASTSVSSFLTPTAQYAASYAGGRVQRVEDVEVARLDGIFDDLVAGGRVFLKVDTQGYDLAVIEGATGCLDHVVGVQIEMSVMPIYEGVTSYIDAFRFMHDRGFSPSGVFSVVRDECLRVYEFDGVFVRARQIGATITPDPGQRVEEPSTDRDRWS